MSLRSLSVATALAAAAILAPAIAAAAKDDPAAIKAGRDALKKELKDKKFFVYFDLSYYVDPAKLKESRWDWKDPPPFDPPPDEKAGLEYYAVWVPSSGGEPGIDFKAFKLRQYQMVGNKRQPFEYPFNAWGKSVPVSKVDDMAEGFYQDWLKECTDPIMEKCAAPKKQGVGPAEWFSTAVGTDKTEKKRVRKQFYVWPVASSDPPCTWLAVATIAEKFIDEEEVLQKAKDMMKYTVEIKDKRAK